MKIKITSREIQNGSKKMNKEELAEHMKNTKLGVGVQKSKKAYNRKEKHKERY